MFENFLGSQNYPVGMTVPVFGHADKPSSCLIRAGENSPAKYVVFRGILEDNLIGHSAHYFERNTSMNTTPVVSAVIKALSTEQTKQVRKAGSLFAQSEIDADEAFEAFARALTEKPTFEMFEEARIEWVSGYLETKPNVKADACTQAFKRFKTRLSEKYGIEIQKPKSDNPVAVKKAKERETKKAQTLAAFEHMPTDQVRVELSKAFATLASKPDSKVAEAAVKNLKAVIRERTKDDSAALKAEVSEKRQTIRGLLSGCSDIERLDAVIDLLSPDNEVTFQ
jgi:hypothetical protein